MTDLNSMTKEQLIALLAKANEPKALTLKVSEKGAVSIYGMGRFPVTLYKGQCERMIELVKSGRLEKFMRDNDGLLSTKP